MATRNAINVLIKLLGGDEMVAELEKLGKTGEKAFKEIEGAANKVNVAQLGGALNAFGKDFATVVQRATIAVTGLVAGVAAAAPAIILLANAGSEAADKVGKAAAATGLQTDAYQKLAFAAEQAGAGQEQFATAMSKFSREIVEAADKTVKATTKASKAATQMGRDIQQHAGYTVQSIEKLGITVTRFGEKTAKGAKAAQTAFSQLGIKVRDTSGKLKTTEQLLLEVAKAFEKMPDGARKSAIAVELFGEAGAKLIPFLNEGADGIAELGRQAEQLGLIFTPQQIKAATEYQDALGQLSATATRLRQQIGLIFVPALTQAARAFRDVILRNRDAILSFVNGAVRQATVLVKDLILALTGDDAGVENTWIVEWRDAIVQFGQDVFSVVNTVVIPAFDALRAAVGLVADAINAFFGTDLTAGQIAITAALIQIIGGFRLLQSAIMLAINAIALFSRAFFANPYLAVIAAVGVGIGLWATRTNSATAALEAHQGLIDDVAEAYRKAGGEVEKMTQSVRDRLLLEARATLEATQKALGGALQAVSDSLAQFDGLLPRAADPIFELARQFAAGTLSVEEFQAAVDALAVDHPELGKLANQIAGITEEARKLSEGQTESFDWIDLLTGKITDAEFQARKTGEAFRSIQPPADVAAPLEGVSQAAQKATEDVQELGRQITVTSFGEAGMSKEVFDVVDGIAKRAEQGKASLDGLGQSATQAGQAVQGVSNEITNSVRDAVPPDAVAPAVDQVISDVDRIAPAAQQTAADANAALSDIGNINASGAEQAAQAIVQPFESLQSKITTIFAGIRTVAQSGFSSIAALVRQLASQIEAEINRIIAALRRAAAEAARLRAQAASSSSSSSSSGGGSQGGFAAGGSVRGPGSGTSDSILAYLSNGEFVMTARAVRKWGVGFLNALNRGTMPKGFNIGGLVDGINRSMTSGLAIPRFAEGGMALAGGGRPFTLQLPSGETVTGMTIQESAVTQLRKFALVSARTSLGRKPRRS